MLTIVECPRDAMQGFPHPISTDTKIDYLNLLLKVGYDTLDFGSFVSPKAIPQMADTQTVLDNIQWKESKTKLLAIVANMRGVEDACKNEGVAYLGYPFSVSETFQLRNTQKNIADSLLLVKEAHTRCLDNGKELVVYLSMGFGNPYGDAWSPMLTTDWAKRMADIGIRFISLADTVGTADKHTIEALFQEIIPALPEVVMSAHLHASPEQAYEKIHAAYSAGCRRFDAAMRGIGGCPFADDVLVGNIATEKLMEFCLQHDTPHGLNPSFFAQASQKAQAIFI